MSRDLDWLLVYTKARCEAWCMANLRNQGYEVLSPLARTKGGIELLFPRYVFVGAARGRDTRSLLGTRGVQRLVKFGDAAARVSQAVIDEIRSRLGPDGFVELDSAAPGASLFDRRQRERLRALVKLAGAGFRVRAA